MINTIVAIDDGLAARFGNKGNPHDVGGQWVSKGTGLSPPLFIMALLAVLAMLSLLRRPWNAVGAVGLLLLGVVAIIAGVGEGLWPSRFSALADALETIGLVLALAMSSLAGRALVRRT